MFCPFNVNLITVVTLYQASGTKFLCRRLRLVNCFVQIQALCNVSQLVIFKVFILALKTCSKQ